MSTEINGEYTHYILLVVFICHKKAFTCRASDRDAIDSDGFMNGDNHVLNSGIYQ